MGPDRGECQSGEVLKLIGGTQETELDKPSSAALRPLVKAVSVGNINSWAIEHPHQVCRHELKVRAGEDLHRVAATWCSYQRCPDRVNTVALLADAISQDGGESIVLDRLMYRAAHKPRLVVSLTSLPSRLEFLTQTLSHMLNQDLLPDAIYINLPLFSRREQKAYVIPDNLTAFIER